MYRCMVTSTVGTVISKLINVRAVIDKRYSPIVYHQSAPIGGSSLFQCHIPNDLKEFIQVLAWHVHPPGRGSEKMILSGMSSDKFHALSSGELLLEHINTQ